MRILFLCVANSARSQMAEGLARKIVQGSAEILSAGSRPTTINPFAIRAMSELGVDLTKHSSKAVDQIPLDNIDYVITLCQEEVCPVVPVKTKRLHWPVSDPASIVGSDEQRLEAFRTARDTIRQKFEKFWIENHP